GSKKKTVVVISDPLALIAEKTHVSRSKEKVVVSLNSEGSEADDFIELKKITALFSKSFNRRKFYSKPTNNNLRTSSSSQSANKKQEFVKTNNKRVEKKDDEKKRDMSRSANKKQEFVMSDDKKVEKKDNEKKRDLSKVKCYNCKKEGHLPKTARKQSDSDQKINANMLFMAQIEKVLSDSDKSTSSAEETIAEVAYYTSESESKSVFETLEYYDKSTNYGLFVNNDDDQEIFHDAIESAGENFIENHIDSQKDYDKSESANKKQEFVKTDNKRLEKKDDEKKRDMSRVKCYDCKKEGHFAKDCKKAKVKDYEYYKTKMLLAKKDKDEQVLLAEDQAWMESSKYYDNSTNYGLFVNNDDGQEIFHDAIESASENFIENHIDSQKDYDKSDVDHNDSKEKDQLVDNLIRKFNKKIVKCQNRVEKANQQSKDFKNQNKDLQDKYDVLKNQTTTFEMNNKELNKQLKDLFEKNNDLLAQTKVLKEQLQVKHVVVDTHTECQERYAKLEAERYDCVNEKINFEDNYFQDIINLDFDKIDSPFQQTSSLKPYVPNVILEKIIIDLEDEVVNLLEKEKANLKTIESLKSKGIGFENPSYFEKAKDLRPTLYDEKVIGLGYTPMFLTHSDEALEIKKFKKYRENKIEFAYDYGNLNVSYVNEKINFKDDYFQEIINQDFEKIDSPFQQTSSLKPYISNVILEKIIIDLEDEVVSLLEKEKANLETIESLKLK
nr:hypothetical protein [Tanacetum cinerariifolium]